MYYYHMMYIYCSL